MDILKTAAITSPTDKSAAAFTCCDYVLGWSQALGYNSRGMCCVSPCLTCRSQLLLCL